MIPGEEKLMKQLNSLQNLKFIEAKLAVNKKIYEESQVLVPIDEGDLKNSGNYDENRVEYGTDHAVHIEFGTVRMVAQPYLRPAYENHKNELVKIAAEKMEKEIKDAIR